MATKSPPVKGVAQLDERALCSVGRLMGSEKVMVSSLTVRLRAKDVTLGWIVSGSNRAGRRG